MLGELQDNVGRCRNIIFEGGDKMDTKTSEYVLKTMLEIKQDRFLHNPIPDLLKALPDLSEDAILAAVSDFENRGIINPMYGDNTVILIAINSSATGYLRKLQEDRELREQATTNATIQNFHINNNNGAVGTNTNFTINNSFDFAEFEELIRGNVAADSMAYKEIKELQHQLQDIVDKNIPISKGRLSKFSELMQRHSWLSGQLTGFLLKWVTG